MNHEEMIDNAIQAAKNAAPLTCADGMAILEMIRVVAGTLALTVEDDEAAMEMHATSNNAIDMTARLRAR